MRLLAAYERRAARLAARRARAHAHNAQHVAAVRRAAADREAQLQMRTAARLARSRVRARSRGTREKPTVRRSATAGAAVVTLQRWWRAHRLRRAAAQVVQAAPDLVLAALAVANSVGSTGGSPPSGLSLAKLQRGLCAAPLLAAAGHLLACLQNMQPMPSSGCAPGAAPRVLLSSLAVVLCPGEFLGEPTPLSAPLGPAAAALVCAIAAAQKTLTLALTTACSTWFSVFAAWQVDDRCRLVATIAAHHRELTALRRLTASPPSTRAEWWPALESQQRLLERKLTLLGERALVAELARAASDGLVAAAERDAALTRAAMAHAVALEPMDANDGAVISDSSSFSGAGVENVDLWSFSPAEAAAVAALRVELAALAATPTAPAVLLEAALTDLRTGVLAATLPRHDALRARIREQLDPAFLVQQARHQALDLTALRRTVAAQLAQLAAPSRDAMLQQLVMQGDNNCSTPSGCDDAAALLVAAIKATGVLRRDLAQFTLSAARPLVRTYAAEVEASAVAAAWRAGDTDLSATRRWLQSALPVAGGAKQIPAAIAAGFVTLLQAADSPELLQWPETWRLDRDRIRDIAARMATAADTAATLALVATLAPGPLLAGSQAAVAAAWRVDGPSSAAVVAAVGSRLPPTTSPANVTTVTRAVHQLVASATHPLRALLRRRAVDAVADTARRAMHTQIDSLLSESAVPASLEVVADELRGVLRDTHALVAYHVRAFAALYTELLAVVQ